MPTHIHRAPIAREHIDPGIMAREGRARGRLFPCLSKSGKNDDGGADLPDTNEGGAELPDIEEGGAEVDADAEEGGAKLKRTSIMEYNALATRSLRGCTPPGPASWCRRRSFRRWALRSSRIRRLSTEGVWAVSAASTLTVLPFTRIIMMETNSRLLSYAGVVVGGGEGKGHATGVEEKGEPVELEKQNVERLLKRRKRFNMVRSGFALFGGLIAAWAVVIRN
ncbi:hypothetical protein F5Y19DRAFT_479307 [Xylariaceae sp. FL1651]|nr:hypothetical protein F5Y19DRAFT_479307 [Xylariaceae sp. FL1651]